MEDPIALSIKARGRNKSGLRVEQRDDGHYYVSRVPRGFKGCAVGDRVLEINGISFSRFKNETKANELIDTFQLQIVPIDSDDGMVTTDDDFDFGSDLEEKAATVPSVGLTRGQENRNKNQRQNSAGSSPKKGPGRRENVEYMDDSDSEEQNTPNTSKNRAKPSKSVPATKAPPPKGPGRRESVEYIDDDDDDDDDENNSPQQQQLSLPSKPGPGRREVVEHLDDDDGTEDEKANSRARNGVDRKPQPKKQPQSGGRRRESVEYLDDDDTEDEEQPKQQTQAGGRRRQTVEYLDDEDTEDEEQPKQQKQTGGRRRETVEYVDDDDTEDDEDADDNTDDDEEYEEVTRQPSNAKASNVPGRKPAPTAADDDDVSEYDGDEESRPRDDDEEEEDDDDDDDDEDYEEPPKPLSASSLRHSMARKQDSRRSLYRPPPDAFERPYTSDYKPMDRWMVTVHKEADEDVGLSIVQYKSELFITGVDPGPFFKTAIDKGDKVLSINGKKVGKHLSSVTEAEELMEGKTQLTIFVLRPDTERDLGYKWVMENC